MRHTLDLAWLTLLEAMRRQIHLITMFGILILLLLPLAANVFGLGASERVVKDVGLTLIGLYGVALALFFGSSAVPADLERKVALPLLTRPLSRSTYLWGKWLGLTAFIIFSQGMLLLALMLSMWAFLGLLEMPLTLVVACYVGESALLCAACLAMSTRCSPPLAAVGGAFMYIVGGLSNSFMLAFLQDSDGTHLSSENTRLLKSLLPDFQIFHVKDAVVHGVGLPWTYVVATLAYAAVWVALLQLLADVAFSSRDL